MKQVTSHFFEILKKYKHILLLIKGSPDPDAIAVCFAIHEICHVHGIRSTIASSKPISLTQNREIIRLLEIPLTIIDRHFKYDAFDAYGIADYQSAYYESIGTTLPCAFHIDHHSAIKDTITPEFTLINPESGSTSTLMALMLKEMHIELDQRILTRIATALILGIETDTDQYTHAAPIDYEAVEFLSRYSNTAIIQKISSIPISKKILQLLNLGEANKFFYKDWLCAGLGYCEAKNRDAIAIVADLLIKKEKCHAVIVYALIEDDSTQSLTLDASFRTNDKSLNVNEIIKRITPSGGGRQFKGAYQINMDYFIFAPDRDLLWRLIELTTTDLLQNSRDNLYYTELKGLMERIKNRLKKLFPEK